MKKLYLVFSQQNGRDTSIAQDTPRIITANPTDALGLARKIMSNSTEDHCVSRILIFCLNLDQSYSIQEFSLRMGENHPNQPLVFIGNWTNEKPIERFFGSFEADSSGCLIPPAEPLTASV